MQGNPEIVKSLNTRLNEELTGIVQWVVQAGLCKNWGYQKLHDVMASYAIQEMHHLEELIDRIYFLGGFPQISMGPVKVGTTVDEMLRNVVESESDAIRGYNESIQLAHQMRDHGTVELLEPYVAQEERHLLWAESQLEQIEQMGLDNYLSVWVDSSEDNGH